MDSELKTNKTSNTLEPPGSFSGSSFSGLGNLFKLVFEQSQHVQCLISLEGRILSTNQAAKDLAASYHHHKLLGQHVWNLPWWRAEQGIGISAQFKQAIQGLASKQELELRTLGTKIASTAATELKASLYSFSFSPIKNVLNTVSAVLLEGNVQLSAQNTVASSLSINTTDELTGVANAAQLSQFLNKVTEIGKNDPTHSFAVIAFKLEDLAEVKQLLGQTLCNNFLINAAKKLTANTRDNDLVARFNQNTFMVVLGNLQVSNNALLFASRCLESLRSSYNFGNIELSLNAYAGIAFGEGSSCGNSLLEQSQEALNRSLNSESGIAVYGLSKFKHGEVGTKNQDDD